MLDPELATHPGRLCTSGERAVQLALELGRARLRMERVSALVARCESFVPPYDCAQAGRDPGSPYEAEGYCLPCQIRRVLS